MKTRGPNSNTITPDEKQGSQTREGGFSELIVIVAGYLSLEVTMLLMGPRALSATQLLTLVDWASVERPGNRHATKLLGCMPV